MAKRLGKLQTLKKKAVNFTCEIVDLVGDVVCWISSGLSNLRYAMYELADAIRNRFL